MKNIFMVDLTHDYYVSIAKQLTDIGHCIKVIGAAKGPEYWPKSLDEYIYKINPKIILWDDFNLYENFEFTLDPDYSWLDLQMVEKLSYYEKIFLMSTDRLSFYPISQIDRIRLFYKFIGHFYKILISHNIESVIFFGTPHGLMSIALFGLAKILKLDAIYIDWVPLSPELSTVETDLSIRRTHTQQHHELELSTYYDSPDIIHDIINRSKNMEPVWNSTNHINRRKTFFQNALGLLLKNPFSRYMRPEFFLNRRKRLKFSYIPSLFNYFLETNRAVQFYESQVTNEIPDKNSLVLFLHFQPEASTMPAGGIFADQLLVLNLILAALPEGMRVYVKEHPYMFENIAQDRHERSVEFYESMVRDPRVKFISRSIKSKKLIETAGFIASVNGTVSWEALCAGKPCIIFGWSWYSPCKSCFSVDSVSTLKRAFVAASNKSHEQVQRDVNEFLSCFEKRAIHAVGSRAAIPYLSSKVDYIKMADNLSRAIDKAIST